MAKQTNYQRSYKRRPPTKAPYDSVLIVCEGSQSEPNYLRGLLRSHNLSSANIKIITGRGSDPMNIVHHAEEEAEQAKKSGEPYHKVYCVFDRDSHANYAKALETINNSEYPLIGITSTPCFEVWVLQHFSNSTAPFSRGGGKTACENVIEAIKKAGLNTYEKNNPNLYETLFPKLEIAITNAIRLKKHNAKNNSSNPATDFHILVQDLKNIKTLNNPLKNPLLTEKTMLRKSYAVV